MKSKINFKYIILVAIAITAIFVFQVRFAVNNNLNQVQIGGPFVLLDVDGAKVTEQDLLGKYSIVFFGFTNCPMICPTGVNNMSHAALSLSDKQRKKVNFVFITLDPERDNMAILKDYFANFYKDFIALTGDLTAIRNAADNYKVYFRKSFMDDENYMIDHSSYIYLMDKKGRYLDHFDYDTPAATIKKELLKHL